MARRPALAVAALLVTAVVLGSAAVAAPGAVADDGAATDRVAGATPWVVSLGDSYISGEAGRWAGSSNESDVAADALGDTAYDDDPAGGELIDGCHRSRSAEIHIGGGTSSLNLACSGAETTSYVTSDGEFKPGLDFADLGSGRVGQATMLRDFATDHDVDLVVVSIGGNDFDFRTVVETCVLNFLTSPWWLPNYCHDDDEIEQLFAADHRKQVRTDVVAALRNVRTAMRDAGHADRDWTLLVQTYPSPMPSAAGMRYDEQGFDRQEIGGCGFWDEDADWANAAALPAINQTVKKAAKKAKIARTEVLDLSRAFDGRRLCESTVGLYEEVGLTSWTQPGAVDKTEWINQIRIFATPPYQLQEAIHPNYWAQLATRSCVRQAYGDGGGDVRGGRCTIAGTGLVDGEPRMRLR